MAASSFLIEIPKQAQLVRDDAWLEPYNKEICKRLSTYNLMASGLQQRGGLAWLRSLAAGMGLRRQGDGSWSVREWAPAARAVYLVGDFNNWQHSHALQLDVLSGIWSLQLPAAQISHLQRYKLHVIGNDGVARDRIPAWADYVVQDPHTHDFSACVWQPAEESRQPQAARPPRPQQPCIYEAHVGMAGEAPCVHGYREFADVTIPHIAASGYNCVQLMAIAEHPYYASFGYHVSSFFAPSSRFGTPDDLKYLIEQAHAHGLYVLLDVVHSHAVKNINEGLNDFDGSKALYFHSGARGEHPQWDSLCFNYARPQVQDFLLANIVYWIEQFGFDGFRFDGVTSMLYWDRGLQSFGSYADYFGSNVDVAAVNYLQLTCEVARACLPQCLLIAEDMSGMPGLCRPLQEGGLGFDYRLAMGLPDYWIKLLEKPDEEWDIGELWHTLLNRRGNERHVAYCESHDQALVGDKTLAFRLMDQQMYWHMSLQDDNLIIDRGMALHKLIRLLSLAAGGEAWLNFMGNEFGHPEWIDFPREGNNNSFQHCRRQWSLLHDKSLRYAALAEFDRAMLKLVKDFDFLQQPTSLLLLEQHDKLLFFRRGQLVFCFNFSPDHANFGQLLPGLPAQARLELLLDSDRAEFNGFARRPQQQSLQADEHGVARIYTLPRSVQVFCLR